MLESVPTDRGEKLSGTQTASRAIGLLRIIAAHAPLGLTLTELSLAAGLSRPTTYRLATCLIAEGMASRDPITRKYGIGSYAVYLGLTGHAFSELMKVCSPAVNRIAAMTQDHVCLVIRTGFHTVPICEIPATIPVRSLARRYANPVPLGATPAGVAFLASFPDAQVRQILAENEKMLNIRLRTGIKRVMPSIIEARANGYAICLNYHIPGVSGIAVSIPTEGTLPYLAISNIAITSRLVGVRQKFLADLLGSEASDLSQYLSQWKPASSA